MSRPLLPIPFLGTVTSCMIVASTVVAAHAVTPQTASPKDSAKWRLATLAASREIQDQIERPTPLSETDCILLTETMNHAMRQNVAAHVSRQESQRLCSELAVQFQRGVFEKRFNAITSHAGEQSPLPVTRDDITPLLGGNWTGKLESTLRNNAEATVAPLFKDARARAVGLLRQEVEQRLRYPTESEADAMLLDLTAHDPENVRLSGEDHEQLQQRMTDLLQPENLPIFEELKSPLAERTRRIASELGRQYGWQLASRDEVARDIPETLRQASSIREALERQLDALLARERGKPATFEESGKPIPVYGFFTTIRNSLPGLAVSLETSRFRTFLNHTPDLSLSAEQLFSRIIAEPSKHRTPADSKSVFATAFSDTLGDTVARGYASGAVPGGQVSYFASLLKTNTAITAGYAERLSSELQRHLPDARKMACEAQFTRTFSDLDEAGMLSPIALNRLQDSGGAAITTLTDALKLFGRSTRAEDELLEETINRVLDLSNRKAREGYAVLTTQATLLRQLEAERLEQLRKDVAARRPLKDIKAEWESTLSTAWEKNPQSRSTPYTLLLETTLATMDKTVRQLYDTLLENPQAALTSPPVVAQASAETDKGKIRETRQEPAHPEDQHVEPQENDPKPKKDDVPQPDVNPSPKDDAQETAANAVLSRIRFDRNNAPDGVLILTGVDSGSAMARLITISENEAYDTSFQPAKPQAAADSLFTFLKPHFELLWRNTVDDWQKAHSGLGFLKKKTPPKMKLMVVIQSDDVRHRMSLILREHLEDAFQEWQAAKGNGTPSVELDWKVGLTFDPLKSGQ